MSTSLTPKVASLLYRPVNTLGPKFEYRPTGVISPRINRPSRTVNGTL